MPTNYPGNIDNYSVKIDGVDTVAASHVNDLQDAVTAVETELGTNPKGSYPSLGAAVAAKAEKVFNGNFAPGFIGRSSTTITTLNDNIIESSLSTLPTCTGKAWTPWTLPELIAAAGRWSFCSRI